MRLRDLRQQIRFRDVTPLPVIVRDIGIPVEEKQMGIEQLAMLSQLHTNIFMDKTSSGRRMCASALIVRSSIAC